MLLLNFIFIFISRRRIGEEVGIDTEVEESGNSVIDFYDFLTGVEYWLKEHSDVGGSI